MMRGRDDDGMGGRGDEEAPNTSRETNSCPTPNERTHNE